MRDFTSWAAQLHSYQSARRYPLLPIGEQRLAVTALSRHDEQTSVEEASLAKLQHLKSGLMTDLLTGRVRVPNDPNFGRKD